MSADRELLELAAKAAGILDDAEWFEKENCYCVGNEAWCPLSDDGDALRLAVKLRIGIEFDDDGGGVEVWGPNGIEALPANGDLASATRRAIVRAAAEIGRAMS